MNDDDLLNAANEAEAEAEGVFSRRLRRMEDFRYDERQEKYWDITTGELLGGKSVDGAIARDDWPTRPDGRSGKQIPYKPSIAINDVLTGLTVEGSTWWPGAGQFLENFVVNDRGAMRLAGAITYNSYTPPDHSRLKNTQNPDKWIELVKFLFPDPVEHEHFFDYAAHMIQHPEQKPNHAIVIAGAQGIGKDSVLVPLRKGVGEWNTAEIDPDAVNSPYNPFVKSVMLVINEVRPQNEDHKASNFYNQLKPLAAAPPELLPMDTKYANTVYVRNVVRPFLTTNDPLTMYIPAEDRRMFVMTSPIPDPKMTPIFEPSFFSKFHQYLDDGGTDAVVRWLLNREILNFTPGDPPVMTRGKKLIIESANQVRRTLADDILDEFLIRNSEGKTIDVVFTRDLLHFVEHSGLFDDANAARKTLTAKNFHFKMDERGYELWRNPDGNEWRNGKYRSRMAFCRKDVPQDKQLRVIQEALSRRPLEFEGA